MVILIRHVTKYAYASPVMLGPHRLMLRPRDSFDLRVLRTGLTIAPEPVLAWSHDVYGNSMAWATFATPCSELLIDSELVLQRHEPTAPKPASSPWLNGAPIAYSDNERIVLEPFMRQAAEDPAGKLLAFAEAAVGAQGGGEHHPVSSLAQQVHSALAYRVRHEEGTQHPCDTLEIGSGSCRDYAWLFIECARRLGYAARFVTGYLHAQSEDASHLTAPSVGFSHAWAEVYVPQDGWIEVDPTNLLIADRQLIRVAVTRTPPEASPVQGSFTGVSQDPALDVTVTVRRLAASELAAISSGSETPPQNVI